MSCPIKPPPCPDTTCGKQFLGKRCKCITIQNNDPCQPTKSMCAYEDGGVYYGCAAGCCCNQCDGQCSSVYDTLTKTWIQASSSGSPVLIPKTKTIDLLTIYTVALGILLVALVLISTIGLFFKEA